MKKIFLTCLVAIATMVMVSCGGKSEAPAAQPAANAENTEATAAEDSEEATETEDVKLDGVALEIAGAYQAVGEEMANVETKEDLQNLCTALAKTLKQLDEENPDYEPDEETAKAIANASETVGKAIGVAGQALGMSQAEIDALVQEISSLE